MPASQPVAQLDTAVTRKPLRVLVVEDSEDAANIVVHELKRGGFEPAFERVDTPEAMRAALQTGSWDAVICDYVMPDFSGPAALKLMQECGLDLPFIVVSGRIDEETAVEMMRAGAHDYVMKDRLQRLAPAVERELQEARTRSERRRAQDALARSERYFRKLIGGSTDAFFVIDASGSVLYCSESGTRLTGHRTTEVLGTPITGYLTPESVPRAQEAMADVLRRPDRPSRVELCLLRKDGSPLDAEAAVRNLLADQDVGGIVVTVHDMTERKAAERALNRANRALRTLSAGNVTLVRAADETTLLAEMCRVIGDVGGYRVVAVGYTRDDAGRTIEPVACSGIDLARLREIPLSWADDESGAAGAAIRTGPRQFPRDAGSSPEFARWREAAPGSGIRSVLALPLRTGAEPPFGALYIAAAEADAFDGDELKLLTELAGDLAFGVQMLNSRAAGNVATEKLQRSLEDSIQAIAATVEMRDSYTAGHQRRVAHLAGAIGRAMGLPEDALRGLHLAGIVHDMGKIGVPAEILSKPTRLNASEMSIIRMHAHTGQDILKDIEFPWPIARIVHEHHERLDGSGYPQGLAGEAILLQSRILAVADVVEAMASHRPYRPGLGIAAALAEIERGRGSAYEPRAVDACLALFRDKGYRLFA